VIADAWLHAIREWKFEPTVIDGEQVAVCMTVTVTIDI
jgi:outer membrane biosynthesis protein TonB